MLTRVALVGVVGLAAAQTIGCATERAPINRVQPNALAKSFFVGEDLADPNDDPEFYARGTLVDVGYGAAQDGLFTSTYAQPMTRIKWVIQEDLLVGRLTYQRIECADGKGAGPATTDGQVVYAYPITSHFDIRRDYNPTTGEETNVVVENSTDRPWNERKYMRVDWSRNLVTDSFDYDTLSLIGIFGGVHYEPLAYYVNDPDSPDAPHFNVEAGYFDVTNKAFAQPGIIDLSGLGWGINEFPSCFLDNDFFSGSAPAGNCNPVELTIRQSFRRVEKSDYEPQDWDGFRFTAFGAFTEDRKGYARNYGMDDVDWHRFASRYNIWEKHHAYVDGTGKDKTTCQDGWVPSKDFPGQCEVACYVPDKTPIGGDPTLDADGDGTHDECAAVTDVYGPGSQCDTFKQKCTLPYTQRTQKPIVWHYSRGSQQEFFEGTDWATQEWDVAMRMAVQASKYAECIRTTSADSPNDDACQSQFPMPTGQEQSEIDLVQLSTEVDKCRTAGRLAGQKVDEYEPGCEQIADEDGAARGYEAGVIALAKEPEMVVLCHSPVEKEDAELCKADVQAKDPVKDEAGNDPREVLDPAEVSAADCDREWSSPNPDKDIKAKCDNGFFVRPGDLRFHKVNEIKQAQTPSPWGIMVDANDPLTGEKVEASINVWAFVNDLASQQAVDLSRYVKGELSTQDVTDGTYVRDWAAAADASHSSGSGIMSKETLEARIEGGANAANWSGEKHHLEDMSPLPPEAIAKAAEIKERMKSVRASAYAAPTMDATYNARRLNAQNTQTEADLVTPTMIQASGFKSGALPTDLQIQNASILRGMNPQVMRNIKQAKELALADRGACILDEAPAPNNIAAFADVLERKFSAQFGPFNPSDDKNTQFARAEAMRKWIAQRYQYGVIIHEMGHSMGLRHNFVTSANAWGYKPQYWQLRTDDGKTTKECTDVSTNNGKDCVGPRYFDPVNDNEKKNLIWMFSQSSVMDYPGETTQDMQGLGAYDFASVRFFYGGVMSVHADPTYNAGKPRSKGMISITDDFGGIVGLQFTTGNPDPHGFAGLDIIHYSQLNKNYDLIHDCHQVDPMAFKPRGWDDEKDPAGLTMADKYGTWDPLIDADIVSQADGSYTRCDEQHVDYVPYEQMRLPKASEAPNNFYRGGRAVDKFKRTRVPYAFATDSWADLGNLSVYRHDNGADPYELFDFFITEQETRHIFDNYRRNRTTFSVRAASNRILERYNEKMRDAAKGLTLQYNFLKDLNSQGQLFNGPPVDFDAGAWVQIADLLWKDDLLASGIAFDHFARQIARPEIGPHSKFADGIFRTDSTSGPINIPNGASGYFGQVSYGGKLIENQLDQTKGPDYQVEYTIDAGSYYDKVYAPYLLTESVDNFISEQEPDFIDSRYRAVSIADLFPDAYRRLLATMLTGDDALKGPVVEATASGTPVVDGDKFPKNGLGWTSWITNTPENCFPGATGIVCASFGCGDGICQPDQFSGTVTMQPFDNQAAPANVAVIDPDVGWEQQKFLIAQTLLYLPENQKQNWINLLGIWEIGSDTDPGFTNRIEFHSPDGKIYVAKTYGTEVIRGKTVQRGIGARILEWANQLLNQGYVTTAVTNPANGVTWYVPVIGTTSGQPIVKFSGLTQVDPNATCQADPNPNDADFSMMEGCDCSQNTACMDLQKYESVPVFLRQSLHDFRMADATMKGIYD